MRILASGFAVLASAALEMLKGGVASCRGIDVSEWKAPISWSNLFGSLHYEEIY